MGSAPTPPAPPSPMEEANASMALEREKARLAQEDADRRKAAEQAEYQKRVAQAAGKQTRAYDDAIGMYSRLNAAQGIDDDIARMYGVYDSYIADLESAKGSLAEDDINPTFSTRTYHNNALTSGTNRYRKELTNKFNEFAGDDFAYTTFGDTADDDILKSILEQQRADAVQQLDAQKARGQLNEQGYSRAQKYLDEAVRTGNAEMQKLGGGVLSGYRDNLTKFRDNTLNKVGTLNLGDSFNIDSQKRRVDDMVSGYRNSLEGDILSAIGGQTFIDPETIISKAGAKQGYVNASNPGMIGVPETNKAAPIIPNQKTNNNLVF